MTALVDDLVIITGQTESEVRCGLLAGLLPAKAATMDWSNLSWSSLLIPQLKIDGELAAPRFASIRFQKLRFQIAKPFRPNVELVGGVRADRPAADDPLPPVQPSITSMATRAH